MLNPNTINQLLNEIKNDGCEYEYLATYIVDTLTMANFKDCHEMHHNRHVMIDTLEKFAQIVNQEAKG